MTITFEGPAVMVADIDAARDFYENILVQKVLADHGPHVAFQGGFFIWQADHAVDVIYKGKQTRPAMLGHDNFELYFESADLDKTWMDVKANWDKIITPIEEAPWGQRGFRVHDTDGHIVEVSEPLHMMVKRFAAKGMPAKAITKRTSMPVEFVKAILAGE